MRYAYACKCGFEVIKVIPLAEFEETIQCPECGGRMGINIVAQHKRTKATPANWPMESEALGVHPDQREEYAEYLKEQGVPTEVNSEGNPILTGREHRKRLCAVTGMYDRNAGYGDKAPDENHVSRSERKRRFEARKRMIREMSNAV